MAREALLQLFYPDKCIVCGKLLERPNPSVPVYTCAKCESKIHETPRCMRCGKPYRVQDQCMTCHELSHRITAVKALFPYEGLYKESILRWKYRGIRKYSKGFARLLVSEVVEKEGLEVDALIPIPIAPNRYRGRGFNQAYDLAYEMSQLTNIPVIDALERTKSTKPQSACTKEERRKNIMGTIRMKEKSHFSALTRIAFIDDIYTTGSTVLECIHAMAKEDILPREIYILTVGIAI